MQYTANKALRKSLKVLEDAGFTITHGTKHLKVYAPDGRFVMSVGTSPHAHDKVPGGNDKLLRGLLRRYEKAG